MSIKGISRLIILTIIGFYTSCRNHQKEPANNYINLAKKDYVIDFKIQSKVSFFDIFSRIDLIPLETLDESIIQEINKIILFNKRIYILDKKQMAVLAFSDTGKFLFKIKNIGNGPGEYSLLYDFDINRFTNKLELLNPRGTLLTYDLDGKFEESISIPLVASHKFIDISNDTILFFTEYEPTKLAFYSRRLSRIVKTTFSFPDVINHTPLISIRTTSPFCLYNNNLLFSLGYSSNVYYLKGNDLVLKYRWDLGEYNFNLNDIPVGKDVFYYANFFETYKKVYCFLFNIENDSYIITKFMYNKAWHTIIVDKEKSEYWVIKKFSEDIMPAPNAVFFYNGIVTSIDPRFIQLVLNPSVLDKENTEIFHSVKLEGNPVILKYYFKK
jgi:hypothetical protein